MPAARWWPRPDQDSRERDHRELRPGCSCARRATTGSCFAIAGRSCTARWAASAGLGCAYECSGYRRSICSANSNENILHAVVADAASWLNVGRCAWNRRAVTRARARDKRPAAARRERAAGAKVDLGPLPRLLGYNLRRANQASWRTYVSFIGENKIRPGLFSLLMPGALQSRASRRSSSARISGWTRPASWRCWIGSSAPA